MPVVLEPVFDPDTLNYTGSTRDADFTLAYTTESPTASVVVTLNSVSVVTGPNTWASGNNVLELVVTDGDKESTYQVNVVYTPPSARLLGFTTSPTALTPAFDPDLLTYSGATDQDKVTVSYIVEEIGASVALTLNGTTINPDTVYTLQVGSNTIVATATHGPSAAVYTAIIVLTPPNAYLDALMVNPVALTWSDGVTATGSATDANFTLEWVAADPTTTVTATLNGVSVAAGANVWAEGSNTVVVTTVNGMSGFVYILTVTYTPPNTYLAAIGIGTYDSITPAWSPRTAFDYTLVANARSFVYTISPEAESAGATGTATLNGVTMVPGQTYNYNDGTNSIIAVVTNGGASRTYTFTVNYNPAYNAKLTDVAFGGVGQTYTPSFDGDYFGPYTGTTTYESNTVRVFKADAATVNQNIVNGVDQTGQQFPYNIGDNTIQIICTNGTTTETYNFVITRTS